MALIHKTLVKQTKALNAASLVWIFRYALIYTSDHFKMYFETSLKQKGILLKHTVDIKGST